MKTITFIRHGESVANAGGRTMPHADIPLSERGQIQAQTLAAALDFEPSTIITSGLLRTQQTAAPFCARFGLQHQVDVRLDELHVISESRIAGMTGPERRPLAKAFWDDPDPHRRLGAGADTFAEFDSRVATYLADIDCLPDRTVVFGHGIWFGLMLWQFLGYRVSGTAGMRAFHEFQQSLPMPNCVIFRLIRSDTGHWCVQANEQMTRCLAAAQLIDNVIGGMQ